MLYFMITYFRPPENPKHERFVQFSTSFIVLVCMIVVSSIVERWHFAAIAFVRGLVEIFFHSCRLIECVCRLQCPDVDIGQAEGVANTGVLVQVCPLCAVKLHDSLIAPM